MHEREGDGLFLDSGAAMPSFCLSHAKLTPVWEISCPKLQGSEPYTNPANKHFCRLFLSPHLLSLPQAG